ncbi:MAG: hypothetical protein VYD19_04470 [Myxococcota bacterium]|nr:hypothetical protein [Myxococcota bacterium]
MVLLFSLIAPLCAGCFEFPPMSDRLMPVIQEPDQGKDLTDTGGSQSDRASIDLEQADQRISDRGAADSGDQRPPAPQRVSCSTDSEALCDDDGYRCEYIAPPEESCEIRCAALTCQSAWVHHSNDDAPRCALSAPMQETDCTATEGTRYCVCSETQVDPLPARPREETDCAYPFSVEALLEARLGYGAKARGGDPAQVYRVTTLEESGPGSLREALESERPYWIVFEVEGTFRHTDPPQIRVRSYKTLDGRGREVLIEGQLLFEHTRDVIISDVTVVNGLEGYCLPQGAAFAFRGIGTGDPGAYSSRNIWLNHVASYDSGQPLLDARGVSDLTISWGRFDRQDQLMSFGADRAGSATRGARVSLHHNFFDQIGADAPRVAFSSVHLFNNYFKDFYASAVTATRGARVRSENNIYQARAGTECLEACPSENRCAELSREVFKRALVSSAPEGVGYAESIGDLLLEGAQLETRGLTFSPLADYPYPLKVATVELAESIERSAGPRLDYCDARSPLTPDQGVPDQGRIEDLGLAED